MLTPTPNQILFYLTRIPIVLMVMTFIINMIVHCEEMILTTNNSEKLLLNICRETVIRILSNRTTADLTGKHTCYTYNGYSLVVYTLTAQDLLKSVFWNPKIVNVFLPLSN